MSRVLITGANGFIGSNLCRWFLERDWEVDALVRKSSDLHYLAGLVFGAIASATGSFLYTFILHAATGIATDTFLFLGRRRGNP